MFEREYLENGTSDRTQIWCGDVGWQVLLNFKSLGV
jgi:hypothetical protein